MKDHARNQAQKKKRDGVDERGRKRENRAEKGELWGGEGGLVFTLMVVSSEDVRRVLPLWLNRQ